MCRHILSGRQSVALGIRSAHNAAQAAHKCNSLCDATNQIKGAVFHMFRTSYELNEKDTNDSEANETPGEITIPLSIDLIVK